MTVVAGRAAVSTARSTAAVGSSQSGWLRLAASLGAFGAFTAVLPSLLVSLSAYIQWARPAVGEAWRDTLMVQVGWSFMITAVVVAGIAVAGSRRHKAVATALAATALCAGLAMTLFNNERMAHIGRGNPNIGAGPRDLHSRDQDRLDRRRQHTALQHDRRVHRALPRLATMVVGTPTSTGDRPFHARSLRPSLL